jgi:hypothetical protein
MVVRVLFPFLFGRGEGGGELLEFTGELSEGILDREPFQAGSADEPDGVSVFIDVSGIGGSGDGTAMGQEEDIFADGTAGMDDGLDATHGIVHGASGSFDSDGTADGGADMSDDGISAGFGHGFGFFGFGHINDAEEVHPAGEGDHFDFFAKAHAGFFEDLAEMAIDYAMSGEIVDPGESHIFDLEQPMPHAAARIGGMDPTNNGDFFDNGKDFMFSDFHGDGIGIAVSHKAGGGAVTGHAEAAGIIYDNEIGPAAFNELGANARARAGRDDRFPLFKGDTEAFDDFFAGVRISFSSPRVWHKTVFQFELLIGFFRAEGPWASLVESASGRKILKNKGRR